MKFSKNWKNFLPWPFPLCFVFSQISWSSMKSFLVPMSLLSICLSSLSLGAPFLCSSVFDSCQMVCPMISLFFSRR